MSAVSDNINLNSGNFLETVSTNLNQESLSAAAVLEDMVDSNLCQNKTGEDLKSETAEITNTSSLRDVNTSHGDVPVESSASDKNEISNGSLPRQSCEQLNKPEVKESQEDEGWLNILGGDDFKKKVIKAGSGEDSRPNRGDWVTTNITCRNGNDELIESRENFKFRLGDLDVITGLEMAVALMDLGEKAEILVPSRLAYGKFGREPDIPPETDLKYEVEVLTVQNDDSCQLTLDERLQLGNNKRGNGNYWYGMGNYVNAIHCYQRAADYLDGIDGSDSSPEKLQQILDTIVKVNNNLAAAHLKMDAHDAALRSLDFVLKMQPNNVKAHFRKGKILATKGLIGDAITEMKMAIKLEPESKIIMQELQRLLRKKKVEEGAQRAMYRRMLGSSSSKPNTGTKSWFQNYWGFFAGGTLAAVAAAGVAAYRQFHYTR